MDGMRIYLEIFRPKNRSIIESSSVEISNDGMKIYLENLSFENRLVIESYPVKNLNDGMRISCPKIDD